MDSSGAQELPLHLEELSGERKLERTAILSDLHREPPSAELQAYFETLRDESSQWDMNTFSEGAKRLTDICGCRRAEYYGSELSGLHYPTTFTELWNTRNPHHPITFWDQDFRRPCPSSWSNAFRDDCWVLRYEGNGPLSHGLNELLQGPTTLDCGMFCQLLLWMAIRYLVGDGIFDKVFASENASFVLTQVWNQPLNRSGTKGSMLYQFYDTPYQEILTGGSMIRTRTFYNHESYLAKHPGGMSLLHNVTQIGDRNYVFDPSAHENILSEAELEQRLLQSYNAPRGLADFEKLRLYDLAPGYVHKDFAPWTFGDLAKEAARFATRTLSESEWKESQTQRKEASDGLCLTFNFRIMMEHIQERCNKIQSTK